MKCLLVDDSTSMLELMKHHLSQVEIDGLEVVTASSGKEAIETFQNESPDVMLLDYVMPDINGMEVLKELGGEDTPLPVVIVTSFNDVETIVEAMSLGAQNYLLKDRLSPGSLTLAIEDTIRKYRLQQDLVFQTRELERFTRTVAHDLKDQISGVYGVLNFLNEHPDGLNENQLKLVKTGCEASAKMQEFVNDLLTYALAGHREQSFDVFSLQESLEEAKRNLAEQIDTIGAFIHQAEELPSIKGSKRLITQVFQNMISNAMKYKAASTPEITFAVKEQDEHWLITVSDNGKGIPKEFQNNIFHAFEQVSDGKGVEGIGVGLATCRRIIQDIHQGRIWVESEPGQGATFYFTLPKLSVSHVAA